MGDSKGFDEAINLYRGNFVSKPDLLKEIAVATSLFATQLIDSGKAEKAAYYITRAVELNADAPGVVLNIGYVKHRLNQYQEAIQFYQKALESTETRATALYNLAGAEARLGDKAKALEYLREALSLNPQFRELAKQDLDPEKLRDDNDFKSSRLWMFAERTLLGPSTT